MTDPIGLQPPATDLATAADCLAGGGNMGALMRAFDWSTTALGPVEQWPQSLKTAVSIMLASGFPMLVLWGDEYIQLYNDAYRPVLGATKHPAALGQRARECWPEIWDDVLGPMFGSVMAGGEPIWSEDLLFVLDRNGYLEETFFTFSYSAIRDESGKPGGILVTCVETTERMVAERRLRTLRELASHASSSLSVADTCRMAAQTLEANPNDVPFAALYLVNDTEAELRATTRLVAGSPAAPQRVDLSKTGGVWPLAEVIQRADVRVVNEIPVDVPALSGGAWPEPAQTAVVLPITTSGQPPAVGALVAGVSPRRAFDALYRTFLDLVAAQIGTAVHSATAYENERERAEALAQIDRAKTAFFSNVSHEFRTPLTLMLAPTQEALSSAERTLSGADLEIVYRNQRRLLKLVNTLLDFSRIEAGRADACYEPTDLAVFTSDLASAFRSAVERGGVALDVRCPPLGEPIYVDRQMWENVVLNLLSNAFKYTFEGTIRVELARAAVDRVELTVADTGVGIPEPELPRVFERFHRVEGTRGRTHEGSGIGLALVSELVKLHGGTVRVTSREGEGSTFVVTLRTGFAHLPADRVNGGRDGSRAGIASDAFVDEALRWLPASASQPEIGAEPRPVAPETVASVGARVLLVDDNADMRDYLVRLLKPYWEVDQAIDGAAALERARERPPDLVLADVMMPGLDGFALIRALRADARTADIPIVVVSARAGDESRIEGMAQGANDYVVKPFSARELIVRINAQLALAAHARERQALLLREQSARREADLQREHLQLLFMQFPAPTCILRGSDFVIELANPAICATWGRRHEEIIGRPLLDVLPELRDQPFPELLADVMRSGKPHVGLETEAQLRRTPEGGLESAFYNFVYAPMRNASGEAVGVLVVAIEVSDQVRTRAQIDGLRHQAEAANKAKDQFLAMLGHELRNPLAPILTALQLMNLRGDESAAKERAVIDRQVRHLVRLVDDLLDVSRIARGKVELRKEHVEMAEIVGRAIEMASPLLEERQHTLSVAVPRRGLVVDADVTRLSQVVMNLLTNAAKYTEPRGEIDVRARRDGGTIEVSVRDSGIGISPDLLPRVFELFEQGVQTFERSQGGLGLGLTIVRSLVELHGGTVAARSEGIGRGSEFILQLPGVDASWRASTPVRKRVSRRTQRRVRVLVVDDNRDAAQMMADALDTMGYLTHVAGDGPTALEVADRFEPDVALLDLGLPVMDGYDLAQHLRKRRGDHLAIVAVTGYGQHADRKRSRDAGFAAHIVKPVELHVLSRVVEELADRALSASVSRQSAADAASEES